MQPNLSLAADCNLVLLWQIHDKIAQLFAIREHSYFVSIYSSIRLIRIICDKIFIVFNKNESKYNLIQYIMSVNKLYLILCNMKNIILCFIRF